jgi:tetratricopeptide (TPR) repeat protein
VLRRIRIPREAECVGRDEELSRLRTAYEQAKDGRGGVLLLTGEAGIGKSRLIDELIRLLERDDEDVNVLYGSYPPGGAATATGAFTTAYREQFGREGSAAYLQETPLLVPAFDALLRGDVPPEGAQNLNAASLQTAFVRATQALGRERPTIVVIDDLHFAPDEGRALFASLAMAVPDQRVLLIGNARPVLPKQWTAALDRLDHVTRIDVPRLGREHVSRLLTPLLGTTPQAERLAESVARTADGNPYFLFEIVRSLRESGVVSRSEDGSWATSSQVDQIELPETVQSVLEDRLSRLTDEEREVLDCAACWGHEFDGRLVAAALGLRRLPTLRALGRLEHEHGLVRAAGGMFVFDHHATQEHLYARLSDAVREELHAELAQALDEREGASEKAPEDLDGALCVDLCEHYLKGGRGSSALRYLSESEAHLQSLGLHERSAALTGTALALDGLLSGAERAHVLGRYAGRNSPLYQLGRTDELLEAALETERIAEDVGDHALRTQAALALGTLHWRASRNVQAETAYRRALELARERGDAVGEASGYVNLGLVAHAQGRLDVAKANYERGLDLSRTCGDPDTESNAVGNYGTYLSHVGRYAEAIEHLELYREMGIRMGSRGHEASAATNLGHVFKAQGRFDEALAQFELSFRLHREVGDRRAEAGAAGNIGTVLETLDRLDEAWDRCQIHLKLSVETGDRAGESRAYSLLGIIRQSEGRYDDARALFRQNLELCRELGRHLGEAIALHNLGSVARASGEIAESAEHLAACLSISESIQHTHLTAATQRALGSARADLDRAAGGDGESGRPLLEAARDVSDAHGFHAIGTLARCELALLPGGDAADALDAFREHADRLAPAEQCQAHYLLWKATRDRSHLEEAKRSIDADLVVGDEAARARTAESGPFVREVLTAWEKEFGA